MYNVALVGGDARVSFIGEYLSSKGYRVIAYGLDEKQLCNELKCTKSLVEAMEESSCIVGGVPMFKDGKLWGENLTTTISQEVFYKRLERKQIVCGGMFPKSFEVLCKEKQVECYDYMKDDSLTIYNAIATAEGAIMEAIRQKNTNIHGSKCLVLGYGTCGRVLARKLKAMDARVVVCARNEVARAWARTDGKETISFEVLPEKIGEYEYVFNTVPSLVVDESVLKNANSDVLIIDIASGKGGVDYDCAMNHNIRAIQCLGLPGKYAPKASGYAIAHYIEQIIACD